jgi:2-iminobutanoate/2-iminopropanoate deaminase
LWDWLGCSGVWIERINPDTVVKPGSRYAQAVVHAAGAKRIVFSGQIGVTPDGRVLAGLEAQARQTWVNIFAILTAAGFEKKHLVKATTFCTQPGQVGVCRKVRDEALGDVVIASTYLEVSGLASPDLLVEIEAEAVLA